MISGILFIWSEFWQHLHVYDALLLIIYPNPLSHAFVQHRPLHMLAPDLSIH